MTPQDLCVGPATMLLPFVKEIFNYKFDEKPNYGRLIHNLKKILLNSNICPDNRYEWSILKFNKVQEQEVKNRRPGEEEVESDAD
jgi:hypothetical protein